MSTVFTDALSWLEDKLPTWRLVQHPDSAVPWWAESPSHHAHGETPGDGIWIGAPDPKELVERVRAFERLVALAMDRAGKFPIGRPQGGFSTEPSNQRMDSPLFVPTELGPPEPTEETLQTAKFKGYDGGEFCGNCGSPNTRRVGACLRCENCGTTSSCG